MAFKDEQSFISCPACGGSGADEKKFTCRKCSGLGLGLFFQGEFLYWGLDINRTEIFLRKFKNLLNFFVDLGAFLVFFGGLGSLVFWIWKDGSADIARSVLFFWQEKNMLIGFFWFACLALMFLIYRADKKKIDEQRIKKIKLSEKTNFPDNWDELKHYKRCWDVSLAYREKSLLILEDAYLLAVKYKHREVDTLHIFSSLLKSAKIAVLFTRLDIGGNALITRLNKQLALREKNINKETGLRFSNAAKEILIAGFIDAYNLKQDNVNALNFLLPCLERDEILREILIDLKIDLNKVKNAITWFRINELQVANYRLYKKLAHYKPSSAMDRAYTAVATPILNNFGYDLTLAAKWGRLDLCVAREKEIAAVFDALKSGAAGVLLTGPEGCGKKTIIEGIAREMVVEKNLPDFLRDKRLIELDVARLVSGADPARAEERLLAIIDEINRAKNIILYIENIENIIGLTAGRGGSLELSEVLSGELARNALYCLASASDHNYNKFIEGQAIGNVFSRLKINEPAGDQAIQILESKVGYLEARHNVFISYNALEAAIDLSAKYIHDKYLPAKAIEVLEKTAVRASGEHKKGKYICSKNDVATTINQMTDIPVQDLGENESAKLLNLEEEIHKYMIDQEEAVKMTADALRRARTELRSLKRPIASFLFLGPTGVGKTELAKTIARVYFQKKELLVRLDMSEYQQEDSVIKMIGDSSGVKGYLTEAVRQKPFSLILLDEFEKAHPKIFNLFLQVMDDGRLTDGDGKTIDFTNSIIIATSNAASDYIQTEVQAGTPIEKIKEVIINEHLNKVMRPELINRFDGLIVFKPLSESDVKQIARLMLKDMEKMLKEKGMDLEISEEGIDVLAREGFDPKFGARPLRRLIQEKIENQIAKEILSGRLKRRDAVYINKNGEIEIKKSELL